MPPVYYPAPESPSRSERLRSLGRMLLEVRHELLNLIADDADDRLKSNRLCFDHSERLAVIASDLGQVADRQGAQE